MPSSELTFHAMGSACHVLVSTDDRQAADELVHLAVERVELLEQCWSRFRPSSELNRLNRAAGSGPVRVSPDLYSLVSSMAEAWEQTGGLFDPTVLESVLVHGYDVDFAAIAARDQPASIAMVGPAPGMSRLRLDATHLTVGLPRGIGIDPGAIGKGLGADIVAAELMSAGADGVLVSLGGDLAITGCPGLDLTWIIGVEDERRAPSHVDRTLSVIEFPPGSHIAGVATSTTLKRQWAQGRRHHVIDPRTGTMSTSDLVQVTIVADRAWRAETLATAALLMSAEDAIHWLTELRVPAILLTADREIIAMDAAA